MKFKVITLFPSLFYSFAEVGVVGQAIRREELQLQLINPRDFTQDRHKTVDDRPFGGGPGMVMMAEPLAHAVVSVKTEKSRVICLSAQGKQLTSEMAQELSKQEDLVLICGRYEGIDERFLSLYVNEQISIGDYVLSGGELAAMVLMDTVSRFKEGVLGNVESAQLESHANGLLEGPQFTRPAQFQGLDVPAVLTTGNHEKINQWREAVALLKTRLFRPDLWNKAGVTPEAWRAALDLYNQMSEAEKKACGLPVKFIP